MNPLDKRIKPGTWVQMDGSGEWYRVVETVADTWFKIYGLPCHFDMAEIDKWTNRNDPYNVAET